MAQLLISAAHKSSGKTTVTLGLCAVLKERGLNVQPFKKGPDYIDPMWLAIAAGRSCYNLDFHTMSPAEIRCLFAARGEDADLCLVEGNKGLHDGLALDGSNSNGALAKLLGAPVVLVLDTRGMTRGVAPLVLGFQAFEPAIDIAGVILNQVGGTRHEDKLRKVMERYTDVPVLGAVRRDRRLEITERHLGLVPSNEARHARTTVQRLSRAMAEQIDLESITKVAKSAPMPAAADTMLPSSRRCHSRIAIARDAAFGFYYADDLDALAAAGAELIPFDTLNDARLPAADGLLVGGGFPEVHASALEANVSLRGEIRRAIESGMPAYAECGGLMYLCRELRWRGQSFDMVGVIPADVQMNERPQGRGYARVRETHGSPWPAAGGDTTAVPCHEFHYSRLENLGPGLEYAYRVERGTGIDGTRDGIIYRNLLASYVHLRNTGSSRWTDRFLAFVDSNR